MPRCSKILFLALLVVKAFLSPAVSPAQDIAYQSELIDQATRLSLAEDPQWLALLHYENSTLAFGLKSRAESAAFFLADGGAYNPQAELAATLRAFFSTEKLAAQDELPQCAFPARYFWLKSKLHFDPARLLEQKCERFEEWFGLIDAVGLTLIFPSSYLNNPASAFGHTLLRLDQRGQNENSRLLAYSANYAAATNGEDALSYAFKGVFGGYDGFFSVAPYYQKVKEYSDMENRDIWEYELNFSPEETGLLVRHLWELRRIAFGYYYFDENCSYQLLSLLEVARPSLSLRSQFFYWVIPVDTIRVVIKEQGLLRKVVFRPSVGSKLNHRLAHSSAEVSALAKEMVDNEIPPAKAVGEDTSVEEKAQTIDLANDYLNYLMFKSSEENKKWQAQSFSLMRERSRLGIPDALEPVEAQTVRPDMGHESSKFSLGMGRDHNRYFSEFAYRPAYHSLIDPQAGFLEGAQIEFFDTRFRLIEEEGLRLQKFTLLDLTSLASRNPLVKPTSWFFSSKAQREPLYGSNGVMLYSLSAGAGETRSLGDSTLAYALLGPSLEFSGKLDDNYALGFGPRAGFVSNLDSQWALGSDLSYQRFFAGDVHNAFKINLFQRYTVCRNLILSIEESQNWVMGHGYNSVGLRVEFFY